MFVFRSGGADDLAAGDPLLAMHIQRAQIRERHLEAGDGFDGERVAPCHTSGERHSAGGRRSDDSSLDRVEIDAPMTAISTDGSELGADRPVDRWAKTHGCDRKN